MSKLKRYNGAAFEDADLKYYDGTEFLPVVTDEKKYKVDILPLNVDETTAKTIALNLDGRDLSTATNTSWTSYNVSDYLCRKIKGSLLDAYLDREYFGSFNSNAWINLTTTKDPVINTNRLEVSLAQQGVVSEFLFASDFETQLTWDKGTISNTNNWWMGLYLYTPDGRSGLKLYRTYYNSVACYGYEVINDGVTTFSARTTAVTETTGTLRIVRNGTTVTFSTQTAGVWTVRWTQTFALSTDVPMLACCRFFSAAAPTGSGFLDTFVLAADYITYNKNAYKAEPIIVDNGLAAPTIASYNNLFASLTPNKVLEHSDVSSVWDIAENAGGQATVNIDASKQIVITNATGNNGFWMYGKAGIANDFDVEIDLANVYFPVDVTPVSPNDTSHYQLSFNFVNSVGLPKISFYIAAIRTSSSVYFQCNLYGDYPNADYVNPQIFSGTTTSTWNSAIVKLRVKRVGSSISLAYQSTNFHNNVGTWQYLNGSSYTTTDYWFTNRTTEELFPQIGFYASTGQFIASAKITDIKVISGTVVNWHPRYKYRSNGFNIAVRPYIHDKFIGNNGDSLDNTLWIPWVGTQTIDNNRAKFLLTQGGTLNCSAKSTVRLSGDFDLQVTVPAYTWTAPGESQDLKTYMYVRSSDNTYFYIGFQEGTTIGTFRMMRSDNWGATITSTKTRNTPCRLRMVKLKNTLTCYHDDGITGSWTYIGRFDIGTNDDFSIWLETMQEVSITSNQTTYFDDLKVVYADTVALGKHTPSKYKATKDYASDTFAGTNGASFDSKRWFMYQSPVHSDYTLGIDTNRMKFTNNIDGGLYLNSRFKFIGNFDIQIDWEKTGDEANYSAVIFNVVADSLNRFDIRRTSNGVSSHSLQFYRTLAGSTTTESLATSLLSGKFKITRYGKVVSVYYWNSTVWTKLGTDFTFVVDDVDILIGISNSAGTRITGYLSNFKINYADAVIMNETDIVPRLTLNADVLSCKRLPQLKLLNPT